MKYQDLPRDFQESEKKKSSFLRLQEDYLMGTPETGEIRVEGLVKTMSHTITTPIAQKVLKIEDQSFAESHLDIQEAKEDQEQAKSLNVLKERADSDSDDFSIIDK